MKAFSASRSCATARALAPGRSGFSASRKLGGCDRHVLELVGDDVDRGGEGGKRCLIVIGGDGPVAG